MGDIQTGSPPAEHLLECGERHVGEAHVLVLRIAGGSKRSHLRLSNSALSFCRYGRIHIEDCVDNASTLSHQLSFGLNLVEQLRPLTKARANRGQPLPEYGRRIGNARSGHDCRESD